MRKALTTYYHWSLGLTGDVILDVEHRGIEDRRPTKGLLWFSGFPALWTSVSLFIYIVNDASAVITESKQKEGHLGEHLVSYTSATPSFSSSSSQAEPILTIIMDKIIKFHLKALSKPDSQGG